VDVRLKEDLLNGNPVQRLRFHILDAGYARADRVLAVGADALLHLRRAETRVLPDDIDDWNVDLREDVDRHDANRRDSEKQNQRGQAVECVRKSQRKSNDAHGCALISPMLRPSCSRSAGDMVSTFDASRYRLTDCVPGANSLAAAARSSLRSSAARPAPNTASNRACACDQLPRPSFRRFSPASVRRSSLARRSDAAGFIVIRPSRCSGKML